MIDFQFGISREDALKTNIFPIDPAKVVEDYRRTGLKPARGVWLDRRIGCACAIGVYTMDDLTPGECLDTVDCSDIARTQNHVNMDSAYGWFEVFSVAFDKSTPEQIQEELDEILAGDDKYPTWWGLMPGDEILAWRNAIACRIAMREAGLEPEDMSDYEED